jgi:hypothetical protein
VRRLSSRNGQLSQEGPGLIQRLKDINVLPESLAFEALGFEHSGDSCTGSYADVFRMEHGGQALAVKRMRSFSTFKDRIAFQQVHLH